MKLTVVTPEASNMLWEPSLKLFFTSVLKPWLKLPFAIFRRWRILETYLLNLDMEARGQKQKGSTWAPEKFCYPPRLYKLEILGKTIYLRKKIVYPWDKAK